MRGIEHICILIRQPPARLNIAVYSCSNIMSLFRPTSTSMSLLYPTTSYMFLFVRALQCPVPFSCIEHNCHVSNVISNVISSRGFATDALHDVINYSRFLTRPRQAKSPNLQGKLHNTVKRCCHDTLQTVFGKFSLYFSQHDSTKRLNVYSAIVFVLFIRRPLQISHFRDSTRQFPAISGSFRQHSQHHVAVEMVLVASPLRYVRWRHLAM